MESSNLVLTCPICGQKFEQKNSKTALFQHKKWCEKKSEFLELYSLSSEEITKEYNVLGSVLAFQQKYPFWKTFSSYYRLFKELEIKVSIKVASNHVNVKQKKADSNLEMYGEVHNFSKNHPSRKKWEKKLLEEEGITNVFQREEVKQKSLLTFLEKYKTEKWKHSLTVRGKGVVSKINKIVFSILEDLNINFSIEFKLKKEENSYYAYDILLENNSYYAYDILLENNKIIEVNGDYWHGNPKIYKKDDLILKGSSGEIKVLDKWIKDNEKNNYAIENGFQILIIWEHDLNNCLKETVEKIKDYATS